MEWRRWRKKVKNHLIYIAVASFVKLLRTLPESIAAKSMAALGRLGFRLAKGERKKTTRHLQIALGSTKTPTEIQQLALRVFENLGSNGSAAIRTLKYLQQGIDKRVHIIGAEYLDAALAKGKGVLGITGHIGCWELMAAALAKNGYPLAVVGKPLYDERLNRILVQQREKSGLINLSRDGAARRMMQWMRGGKMLGVLIDQDTDVESEFVDVMGRQARTPIAPMLLAQRVGAAIVPMATYRQPDGRHVIDIRPEIELVPDNGTRETRRANLTLCSKAIEAFILEHPEQWVWMHERWKTPPA